MYDDNTVFKEYVRDFQFFWSYMYTVWPNFDGYHCDLGSKSYDFS